MEATINKEDIDIPKSQLMDFDVYKASKSDPFYFIYVSLATVERMRVPMKLIYAKDWPKDEPVEGKSSYYYVSCCDSMSPAPYQGDHDPLAIERVFLVSPVSCTEHVKKVLKTLRDMDEKQRKFLKFEALIRDLKMLHSRREISDQVLIRRLKEVETTGPIMSEYIKSLIRFHEQLHENKQKTSEGLDYKTEVARARVEHFEMEVEKANPCGEIDFGPSARTQIGYPKDVDSHTDEDLTARGKRKEAEAALMFEICAFDRLKAKTAVATLRQLGFESDESAKSCLLAIDNKIKELNALRDVVKEM